MTKTLTEQWGEGTLDGGYYYLKMKDGNIFIDHTEYIFWSHEIRWETKDGSYIKEVLAPVPAYNVWKNIHEQWKVAIPQIERLEKQLEIATKALNDILNDGDDYWDKDKANEALTKMEGVK